MKHSLVGVVINNLGKAKGKSYDEPILIPKPKQICITEDQECFVLQKGSTIGFVDVKQENIILDDLNETINQLFGFELTAVNLIESDITSIKITKLSELLDLENEESYNLEVLNGQILIRSPSEKGLFYGIQTLIQLIKNVYINNKSPTKQVLIQLPKITIKDFPDLKIRGVAQDISRGQVFTVENAKRYLKILSHYKMNFYCIYMEDMFAHPKHPKIGKDRGALTCDEIKEIDRYAKERYIELVPIFECLGHVDNILQHPEYAQLGEFPGAHSLNISNPNIYEFLSDYISEISKCFSSNYFHIGCDESFDIGRYRSKDFIKKHGKSQVLVDFYENLYQMAKENDNKYVIMYDDIVRKNEYILKNLNKDIILMYWDYSPKKSYPDLKKLLKAGFKVISSPSMLNWQRNFPDNHNASKNIINFIKAAYNNKNEGCLGVLTSTWGDMRYYSFRENEIFGGILTGAVAWSSINFEYQNFIREYGFLFFGIEKANLAKYHQMFTKLSNSADMYYRISVLLPPLFFTYFFKHPFPKKDYTPPFENYQKLTNLANESLKLYEDIKSKVIFEVDNFEYLEFAVELAKYLGEKIEISIVVSKTLQQKELSPKDIDEITTKLNYIKGIMIYLRDKFQMLWLRAAKKPCSDHIIKLFDFIIDKYDEKLAQIYKKIHFKDPYIESEWIWTLDKTDPLKPRYFRKIIEIHQPLKKAIIQGIASNHMKIYLNHEYIGEVLSRYSMSILPIVQRVKTFDITHKLKKGKNIIAIEAHNYDGFKGAINLYGQILLNDNSVKEIISDDSWLSLKQEMPETNEWLKVDYNDNQWIKSYSYGRPPNLNGDIFRPDLLKGEISDTQDYFGIEGYMSNFTEEYDEQKLEHMINIFKPYGN